jgi:hypothetical protein
VVQQHIYKEPYFDPIHQPDRDVVAAIRERFVANDLFSPFAEAQAPLLFAIERDIKGRQVGPGA